MKLILKSLTLTNFKGVRSQTISFGDITNIYGDNATGKTTIFDAFLWLLFGKDSTDRKDFEIKTLDENNRPYHRLDHEVTANLFIDDQELTIRRSLKENWVKKRGESTPVFSGHTTSFFWNDVPMKESEFQSEIGKLINEGIFKLITNSAYFNSQKWQERRNVLVQLAGEIKDEQIFDQLITVSNKGQFTALINALNQRKTIDQFKSELRAKKKKLKDELDLIPSRIDEANRSLPETVDYATIEKTITEITDQLQQVETQLMDRTAAQKQSQEAILNRMKDIQKLKEQRQNKEFEIKQNFKSLSQNREQNILDKKSNLRTLLNEISRTASQIADENSRKARLETEAQNLRAEWGSVNAEALSFDEKEFHCPTCKREYETADVNTKKEELIRNFNQNKSTRLSNITEKGRKIKGEIELIETRINNLKADEKQSQAKVDSLKEEIETLSTEHERLVANEASELNKAISSDSRIVDLSKTIERLESEADAPQQELNNSDLLSKKAELTNSADQLKHQLSTKSQRERILARIEELKNQEAEMSHELASLEGQEYSIDQYTKAKMDTLISRINNRFQLVKFKLFADQINGGEIECCETLINGVPYSDANYASRINAGLDIINTLCDHYGVYAPVFVDNAESVNTLQPLNSQLIRLVVTKDKKLKIESSSTVMEAVS